MEIPLSPTADYISLPRTVHFIGRDCWLSGRSFCDETVAADRRTRPPWEDRRPIRDRRQEYGKLSFLRRRHL